MCTSTEKFGNVLIHMLPLFLDEFFLHPGEKNPVIRAATKAFSIPGVLDNTAINIFHSNKGGNLKGQQLALSTPYLPWGIPLPPCSTCFSALLVRCMRTSGPTPSEKVVGIQCRMCNRLGVASKPKDAVVIRQDAPDGRLYMQLTYPSTGRVVWS
jgi:hypothetical protein